MNKLKEKNRKQTGTPELNESSSHQKLISRKAHGDERGRLKNETRSFICCGTVWEGVCLSKTVTRTDGVSEGLATGGTDGGLQCVPGYGDTHRRGLCVVSLVVHLYPTCQNILFALPLFISSKSRTVVMGSS